MSYQKFTISRAIALSLSVGLLTAAPLLCMQPIPGQIKRAQRAATRQHREGGVVPGNRTSFPPLLATSPRPAAAQGALAHAPQREDREAVRDGENRFKAPILIEVTRAECLPVPEPTWNETEIPDTRVTPVASEAAQ